MSTIPIAGLGWGVVQDADGDVQAGVAYSITLPDNTPVASGSTNTRGEIPGNIANGVYKLTVLDRTLTVHASEADLLSAGQQAALAGTNGSPSVSNRFLSETDSRIALRQIGTNTTPVRESAITGDTQPRWQQQAGGAMLWGQGATTAPDVQFERVNSGRLRWGVPASTLYEGGRIVSGLSQNRPPASLQLEGLEWRATDTGMRYQVQNGAWVNAGNDGGVILTVAQFLALVVQPDGTIVNVNYGVGKIVRLRFNNAATPPYKWEAYGEQPSLYNQQSPGIVGTASATPWQTTPACSITIPLAGIYEFDWKFSFVMGVSMPASSMIAGKPQGGGIGVLGTPSGAPADAAFWGSGFATGASFGAFMTLGEHSEFTFNTQGGAAFLQYTSINFAPTIYNQRIWASPIVVSGP